MLLKVNMVTVEDIRSYLETLKHTYDECAKLDLIRLYDYLLTLEERYVTDISVSSYMNYPATVHKLNPFSYASDRLKTVTFTSSRSRLICCYCDEPLPLKDVFPIHVKASVVNITCNACQNQFNHDTWMVIYFRRKFGGKIVKIINTNIGKKPSINTQQLIDKCDLREYTRSTWIELGDYLRKYLKDIFIDAYPVEQRYGQKWNQTRERYNKIWKEIVTLVDTFKKQEFSSLSFDLVRAMFRHLNFLNTICSNYTYWIDPTVLEFALQRYQMFIRIIPNANFKYLVPTLDIDLVWHTHLQSPDDYKKYTNLICGRTLNYINEVSDENANVGYTRIYMKWSQLYRQAYSDIEPSFMKYRYEQPLRWVNPSFYYKWLKYNHPHEISYIPQMLTDATIDVKVSRSVIGTPVNDPRALPPNSLTDNIHFAHRHTYKSAAMTGGFFFLFFGFAGGIGMGTGDIGVGGSDGGGAAWYVGGGYGGDGSGDGGGDGGAGAMGGGGGF